MHIGIHNICHGSYGIYIFWFSPRTLGKWWSNLSNQHTVQLGWFQWFQWFWDAVGRLKWLKCIHLVPHHGWVHHSGECAPLTICRCRGCLWPALHDTAVAEKLALVSPATRATCIFGISGVLIAMFVFAQFEGFSAWERIARAARKM